MKDRKKFFACIVFVLCFFALSGCESDSNKSLVPEEASKSPNAWCSWWAQNYHKAKKSTSGKEVLFEGDQGATQARENINDSTVFAKGGWLDDWDRVRKDLIFLFDDGWDVKPNIDKKKEICQFGSLEVNEQKFPSCADKSPAERLRKLNEAVKARGWKGAGLWIAAQSARPTSTTPQRTEKEEVQYWKERILWCKHAKINYWKLDWGTHGGDPKFRKMLTDLAEELYPELLIEHSIPRYPVNDLHFNKKTKEFFGSGEFAKSDAKTLNTIKELLKFSKYTRVYDTIPPLTIVTTIDRTAWYLQEGEKLDTKNALLNVEDEIYTGAGLGCALGVMRSSRWGTPQADEIERAAFKTTEVVRAVRWSRIAPAFPLSEGKTLVSDTRLEEKWLFDKGETWWGDAWEKTLYQSAPAVVVRNLPLPKVLVPDGERLPYVLASVHPNGSVALATRPRLDADKGLVCPLADIEVDLDIEKRKVGLFGKFKSVSFKFPRKPKSILAQDLARDSVVEILDECEYADGKLKIFGAVMEKICQPAFKGDVSDPAIVFIVK